TQFGEPNWVGTIDTNKISEASGLAASRINPAILWTHNDGSGGKVYAIGTNAVYYGSFDVGTADDTEDIAMGPGPASGVNYIYLGDIGSNDETRGKVRIIRAPEPVIDPAWAQNPVAKKMDSVEVFELRYPDGQYNSEALMIDSVRGELFIATKQLGKSRIYSAPLSSFVNGQTGDLQFVREVQFPVVSGADISADGKMITLRNEQMAYIWIKEPNTFAGDALAGTASAIPVVGTPEEPNGEAIAFNAACTGYYTLSEGVDQPLYYFPKISSGSGTIEFSGIPQRTDQGWQLPFSGCPGMKVGLFRSTDLAQWNLVADKTLAGEEDSFVDNAGTGQVFYRLQTIP
ncbi:MAG: hypothetical protein ACTHMT_09885, partial [Verrucomicrobiota bacterium]